MLFRLHTTFLCIIFSTLHIGHAQLLSNEDNPPLIDRLLQVVWEPSSLIRWWTALDQMYNIALGWRRAARTVATLPFREGRSMDNHIRIKEPRHISGRLLPRKSDIPHLDWFNKVYTQSLQSASTDFVTNNLHLPEVQEYSLPPPFLFRPQEVFAGFKMAGFNMADKAKYQLFHPRDNPAAAAATFNFQNAPGLLKKDILQRKGGKHAKGQPGSFVPLMFFNANGASSADPQEKLRLFLKLMKKLGEVHASRVNFDDDVNEKGV